MISHPLNAPEQTHKRTHLHSVTLTKLKKYSHQNKTHHKREKYMQELQNIKEIKIKIIIECMIEKKKRKCRYRVIKMKIK